MRLDTPSGRDTTGTGVPFSSCPEISQQLPFCGAQKSFCTGTPSPHPGGAIRRPRPGWYPGNWPGEMAWSGPSKAAPRARGGAGGSLALQPLGLHHTEAAPPGTGAVTSGLQLPAGQCPRSAGLLMTTGHQAFTGQALSGWVQASEPQSLLSEVTLGARALI